MDDHDGADAIERAWRDGLKPDPLLTVSEWADRYRVLSQRASSEPGRWRTERTPYLKDIMDCLSPSSPVQRVALMKGAQIGGTECGNCWIGYVIHQAPGPMMAVSPTVELAKRNSKQRIDPLIEESEVLRERVKERRSRGPRALEGDGDVGERGIRRVLVDDRQPVPRREGLGPAARCGKGARGGADPEGDRARWGAGGFRSTFGLDGTPLGRRGSITGGCSGRYG